MRSCPRCASAFTQVLAYAPVRRLVCGVCHHAWVEDGAEPAGTEPPPTMPSGYDIHIRATRPRLVDLDRTLHLVLPPGVDRAEFDGILVEVVTG